jgi:hypothetical protein
MKAYVPFVAFLTAILVVGLASAGEPKLNEVGQKKRPMTPREANLLKLALSQQQKQRDQMLQDQRTRQAQASQRLA